MRELLNQSYIQSVNCWKPTFFKPNFVKNLSLTYSTSVIQCMRISSCYIPLTRKSTSVQWHKKYFYLKHSFRHKDCKQGVTNGFLRKIQRIFQLSSIRPSANFCSAMSRTTDIFEKEATCSRLCRCPVVP